MNSLHKNECSHKHTQLTGVLQKGFLLQYERLQDGDWRICGVRT